MIRLKIKLSKAPGIDRPGLYACVASIKSYPWILEVDNLPFQLERLQEWLRSGEIYYLEVYE